MAAGKKTGGGSRKGKPNKATIAKAAAIANSGLMPLDYFLQLLRDESLDHLTRLDAAKAAANYVHPRLQPVDGKTGSSEIQARVRVEFVGPAS